MKSSTQDKETWGYLVLIIFIVVLVACASTANKNDLIVK